MKGYDRAEASGRHWWWTTQLLCDNRTKSAGKLNEVHFLMDEDIFVH
jgi:hypothetical protein